LRLRTFCLFFPLAGFAAASDEARGAAAPIALVVQVSAKYVFESMPGAQLPSNAGKHTIILIQTTSDPESRTYTDHASVSDAIDSLLQLFERHLRAKNQGTKSYETPELFAYLDGFHDLSALVFEKSLRAYAPLDRKMLKNAIYQRLRRDLQ
jgi:hypothetical protein